jgi:hypothetical protein
LVHVASTTCLTTISTSTPCGIHRILKSKAESQGSSLERLKINENNNFQHYNILSAYEIKDETSMSRTYVSLVFNYMVRSRKILVKKEL